MRLSPLPILAIAALTCAGGLLLANCSSFPRPKVHSLSAEVSFAGPWDSTWGRMDLMQDGTHVHGTFTGYREGSVSGKLDGDVFRFIWDQRTPRQHGHGFMQITPDGQHLEGRWGYMEDDIDGGRWAADKAESY